MSITFSGKKQINTLQSNQIFLYKNSLDVVICYDFHTNFILFAESNVWLKIVILRKQFYLKMIYSLGAAYTKRSQSIAKQQRRYSSTIQSPEDESLAKKVSKIAMMNLREHQINICACEQCIYKRQLNRRLKIGLDLSKSSSYRYHFDSKASQPVRKDLQINYESMQREKTSRKAVTNNSSYESNYRKDAPYDKPQRSHPQDGLKFVGPTKGLSSYGEQYPAFKNNASPYIKPIQVVVPNNIKMDAKSTYQLNYLNKPQKPTQSGKNRDHLHSGLPWTGDSTYRQIFKDHQRSTESRQVSSRLSTSMKDPNYIHQYETTYRNQYLQQGKKKCERGGSTINPLLQSLKKTLQM